MEKIQPRIVYRYWRGLEEEPFVFGTSSYSYLQSQVISENALYSNFVIIDLAMNVWSVSSSSLIKASRQLEIETLLHFKESHDPIEFVEMYFPSKGLQSPTVYIYRSRNQFCASINPPFNQDENRVTHVGYFSTVEKAKNTVLQIMKYRDV